MRELHLVTVGKLKDKNIEALENEYLKRLKLFKITIHELKTYAEDLDKEAQEVLKKIQDINQGNVQLILMAEKGREFDSPQFSEWLFKSMDESSSPLVLVIGGASGHGKILYEKKKELISLGKMTYPHQFARLILIEQLYRAQTIKENHPYHK